MNENITTILKIQDKDIENLWNTQSVISLSDFFFRLGKSKKTLKKIDKLD